MALLGFLGECSLPVSIPDFEDIERVLLLRETGLIEAEVPPRIFGTHGCAYVGGAVIQSLTPTGLALARRKYTCEIPLEPGSPASAPHR